MPSWIHADFVVRVVLIAVGLLVVISALAVLLLRSHLVDKAMIDLKTGEKLGGFSLKTNAFGLILLVGGALTILGVFLLNQNYDERLTKLQSDYDGLSDAVKLLTASDQTLNLIFPPEDPPSPDAAVCHAFVLKKNESQERSDEANASFRTGPGGLQVTFRELKNGDYIRVEVKENGRKWKSESVPFGAGQLTMKLLQ